MHQIFYITIDPEKALGVEDLIPSYHILYSAQSQIAYSIANEGIDIHNFTGVPFNSTSKLLDNNDLLKYIKDNSYETPNVLVFKNEKEIQQISQKHGLNLLNPNPNVGSTFENKIKFSQYIDNFKELKQPEYTIFTSLKEMNYIELTNVFSSEFVIQFMFGHSGNSTFFIENENDLIQLQKQYPLRKAKVSRKIEGYPYTVNACITREGVVIGGISEQITGIKNLTRSLGGTVGNDYSQRHLNDLLRYQLIETATKIGNILQKEGHRGIFGIDVVIERATDTIFIIEVNTRQTASVPFTSYVQRLNQITPIMLWHILELTNFNFSKNFNCISEEDEEYINKGISKFRLSNDKIGYNVIQNQPIQASQVFFRNIKEYAVQILEQFPSGIYRTRGRAPEEAALLENSTPYNSVYRLREDGFSTLCLINRGYNIMQANRQNGFVLTCAGEKSIIEPFGEIGRVQFLESAFSSKDDMNIHGWITDVINTVYENMRIIKNHTI